jgi:hypothetical protein
MNDPCFAPTFASRNAFECFVRSFALIFVIIFTLLFAWIPSAKCVLLRALFELRKCRQGNHDQNIDLNFDPNEWLAEQQLIGAATIWQEANGELHPYFGWTAAERKDLYDAFWKARLDEETGIPAAPADATPEAARDDPVGYPQDGTWYPRDLAWRTFIAYAAQTLAVENAHWVSWSLVSYSGEQLSMLLDSRSLFGFDPRTHRYALAPYVHGMATPGDPVRTFRFIRTLGLDGATSHGVIERLLDWCRANLIHFLGGSPDQYLNHWQYSGYPPVERIISGTMREHPADWGHFTEGCHGTLGFLRAVLRTVNLPVERLEGCDRHSQVHFVREDLFLGHGDDPYSSIAMSTPLPPAVEMLIDRSTYESWFGSTVPHDLQCANLDRRMTELALRIPNSDALLRTRCRDIAAGRSNPESWIYRYFGFLYSVEELEAMGLWRRLDEEIVIRGGCDSIPSG